MAADPGTQVVEGNPIITECYTSDPTVIVHDGTVYLYTGHDEAPPGGHRYVMRDWLCFSSTDLLDWRAHGPILRVDDFRWARDGAKGSNVIVRDGRFYWYVAVNHSSIEGGAIGVAVADTPTGPFTDARGEPLITNDLPFDDGADHTIDPCAIVHGDEARLFWGKGRCFTAPLDPSMTALAGPITTVDLPEFQEGAHVHERDGWFYLSYGYRHPQRLAYAMSRSLDGPWTFAGILNEVPGNCETNRAAVLDLDDGSYFLYHNGVLPGGGSHRRSVCIDRLRYAEDGRMLRVDMTTEGLRGGSRDHPVPAPGGH